MASDQVQVLLDPQADEDTQQAVLAVLSRAGLVGSTSVREGKGLPDVPWGDIPWNHVVTLVLQQGQGLAEDARGFLAGLVLEHFRQKLAQRRSGVETPSTAAPAPTSASGRLAPPTSSLASAAPTASPGTPKPLGWTGDRARSAPVSCTPLMPGPSSFSYARTGGRTVWLDCWPTRRFSRSSTTHRSISAG